MRYVLVDRFLELEAGSRALAVKCVTLGEEFLQDGEEIGLRQDAEQRVAGVDDG